MTAAFSSSRAGLAAVFALAVATSMSAQSTPQSAPATDPSAAPAQTTPQQTAPQSKPPAATDSAGEHTVCAALAGTVHADHTTRTGTTSTVCATRAGNNPGGW